MRWLLCLLLCLLLAGAGAGAEASSYGEYASNATVEYEGYETVAPSQHPTFDPTSAPTPQLRRISRAGCRKLCQRRSKAECTWPTFFIKCACHVWRRKCYSGGI